MFFHSFLFLNNPLAKFKFQKISVESLEKVAAENLGGIENFYVWKTAERKSECKSLVNGKREREKNWSGLWQLLFLFCSFSLFIFHFPSLFFTILPSFERSILGFISRTVRIFCFAHNVQQIFSGKFHFFQSSFHSNNSLGSDLVHSRAGS